MHTTGKGTTPENSPDPFEMARRQRTYARLRGEETEA